MGVHPKEIAGKERGFIATGAGANFDDGIARIRGVGRHEAELHFLFERGNFRLQTRNFLGGHLGHLIAATGEFLIFRQLLARLEVALAF